MKITPYDLKITRTTRQAAGGGTWVCGTLAGYRFDALVFPEHAENPEWEIGQSQIGKLWLAKTSNKETVYNWDRGPDVQPASPRTQAAVDFLTDNLAQVVYPQPGAAAAAGIFCPSFYQQ